MRRTYWVSLAAVVVALGVFAGCGNPLKRDSANVFPGSEAYEKRIKSFDLDPVEAYEIALEQAEEDNRLQFLSKRPTVVVKRWYVFSMPQASGASLKGYHVNGDSGKVRYVGDSRVVHQTR
jgi:hypothetical protein